MLFEYAAPETAVVSEMARQHCGIIKALLDRNIRRARKMLTDHIRMQKGILQKLIV